MHRFIANVASGLRGLPALGAGAAGSGGRATVVALALAGGTVAYMQSYPRSIPVKDPTDERLGTIKMPIDICVAWRVFGWRGCWQESLA